MPNGAHQKKYFKKVKNNLFLNTSTLGKSELIKAEKYFQIANLGVKYKNINKLQI